MIQPERIQPLNDRAILPHRDYVLYWMQQAQRAEWNHALEFAVRQANDLRLPLLAVFGLTQRFPDANQRHYAFLLEGLAETQRTLRDRGVRLLVCRQPPMEAVADLGSEAALIVTDRGYLRIQRQWRQRVAERATCRVIQVESDVVVPIETASPKEEYAARTLRPKIHDHWERFMVPLVDDTLERDLGANGDGALFPAEVDPAHLAEHLHELRLNRDADPVDTFRGGTSQAHARLEHFLEHGLPRYAAERNDATADAVSHMSPYLHLGQISPLEIALRVRSTDGVAEENKAAYLEELVVRRELSMNYCFYNPHYDRYEGVPSWARETLAARAADPRPYIYTAHELETAQTHDPYWNAAQREMVHLGKMHGYLRMYWGKKILEWVEDPAEALAIALTLNNRYELDGRDPNGYAGVAWCFGKHDRPWPGREILGTVRSMTAAGLARKMDIDGYVRQVAERIEPIKRA